MSDYPFTEPTAVFDMPRQAALVQGRVDAVTLLTFYILLLFAIPASLVVGPFGAAGPPATLFSAGLLLLYLLARTHPASSPDGGRQPVRAAMAFFCCATLGAYVSANRAAMAQLESNGADRGLILLAGWLGVCLIAADCVESGERLNTLLRRVVFGASAMSVLGLVEFVTGTDLTSSLSIPGLTVHAQVTDLMTREGLTRVNATASQPLEYSAVLLLCLPLAIHQARYADRSVRLRRWVQVALIGSGVPMAISRSAILALLAVVVILLPTWPRSHRRRAYLAMLFFPPLIYLGKPGMLGSLASTFAQLGNDSSSTSRSNALSLAGPLVAQHPWFGMGFQTFFPQSYFFVDDQLVTSLIETGVAGLLAVLGLFAAGWYAARKARTGTTDVQMRDLAWSLTASLAVALISFATFDVLSFTMFSGVFFLLLGCAGAACRLTRDRHARSWPPDPWPAS